MHITKMEGATLDEVRALLASKDDSVARQLRVTKFGRAFLSDKVGADDIGDLAFRFETWDAGNGYCGVEAASDERWVRSVHRDLHENWPNPKDSYIDW